MSDIEIDELIKQINTNDLLELLIVEKGSIAKIMIESISMTAPAEIMYKAQTLPTVPTFGPLQGDESLGMIQESQSLE